MKLKGKTVIYVIVVSLGFGLKGFAQESSRSSNKKEKISQNWHHLDIKKNKIAGISTEKAYIELLKNRKPTTVIVAVIDGGIDINHEDLKNKIWTNTKEIPGNGIDDDNNGFVDDLHGWNFLGSADGKNIKNETLELTRLYRNFPNKFKDTLHLTEAEKLEFEAFKNIKSKFYEKYEEAKNDYNDFLPFKKAYFYADSIMKFHFGKNDYTLKDLKKFDTGDNKDLTSMKEMLIKIQKKGIPRSEIVEYAEYLDSKYLYHYNISFNPRSIIGDDINEMNSNYGNNDVIGPDPEHGTFVSGIIAAERNNNLGLKGIADSVKIMVLRAVPNGDEYDKDIANAIIYAVNNGAQIINCSFGKDYSPQKQFVDEAIRLAGKKDVLIIHAAGNDAEDIDSIKSYPTKADSKGNIINDNWITVGASTRDLNTNLVATFSNYGKNSVDIFAPGYRIYSSLPFNKYGVEDGTSFASPMVAGAAALIKSYYPSLKANQIKDILLKSGEQYPQLMVVLPMEDMAKGKNNLKVPFGSLSQTGSILNIYNALKLAGSYYSK